MGIDELDIIYIVFSFIFGAIIGSFLNVLVYRLPNKMSIISPSSHCFSCNHPIKWYDNIPILSYIILGGKCRHCKSKYSPMYMIVELLTAVLFTLTYLKFRFNITTIFVFIIISCFIVIFLIDLKHLEIPDSQVVIILLVSIASFFVKNQAYMINYKDKLYSIIFVLLVVLICLVTEKLLKKEILGFGDIKLFLVVGLFTGIVHLLLGIFIASVIALVIELLINRNKHKLIPFGPYLTASFLIVIFFGSDIINWYISLIK